MNKMTREEALKLVKEDGFQLEDVAEEFKKDKEIVLAAINSIKNIAADSRTILEYASESLKKEPVLLIIDLSDEPLSDMNASSCCVASVIAISN